MLFKQSILEMIADGRVTYAFRRWKRPTVKAGGTLTTSIGVLAIEEVKPVEPEQISGRHAVAAGFDSLAQLKANLATQRDAPLYRIRFRLAGEDPRIALRREDDLSADDLTLLLKKLERYDAASKHGAWTERVLEMIDQNPNTKAGDLAEQLRVEKEWLKTNIRKLKQLGLTESLSPGYQISPRGAALLDHLKRQEQEA
ncbi:hypothetical protein LOC68_21460 [Blastopirellula sp. JC732]|uniref:ASCH domain-containing protein n=1 Tax=Blastopirellula sediminis TaxID=2894196 RepID=A0A9X1MQC5_9BACT|nr:hypothetical protein [Blastopirellula sediminis]MCC9605734.1 hypothetical protein [Blastopirellula sediminis]MCC9630966.1 hypothetical protein [Blastopirellula sediminis]